MILLTQLDNFRHYKKALYPLLFLAITVFAFLASREMGSLSSGQYLMDSNGDKQLSQLAPATQQRASSLNVDYRALTLPTTSLINELRSAVNQMLALPSHIGDTHTFILDTRRIKRRPVTATLRATGQHTAIWVDNTESIPQKSVLRLMERFDENVYPRNTEYFATSTHKQPAQVNILVTDLGAIDGYFDPGDLAGWKQTNIIYVNAQVVKNEPAEACSTIAHEFAHLLFYVNGGRSIKWLDEGLAVYAEHINGGNPDYYVESFRRSPDVKLTGDFSNESYGAAFLFIAFAADQVEQSGNSVPAFTRALIENSGSTKSINAILHQFISDPQLDSVGEIYRSEQLVDYVDTDYSLQA